MTSILYTVGHSNHEISTFLALLRLHGITALCDVRSHPYSRYLPQYCRDALRNSLSKAGIAYVFLGKELGARSDNPACYLRGKVQYDRLSREPCFAEGIRRVVQGMDRYRIALTCAERDPIECHRALLVARQIFGAGFAVSHIHADGSLERHEELESRLLALCKLPEGDLFTNRGEFLSEAYLIQGGRVAHQDETMKQDEELVVL